MRRQQNLRRRRLERHPALGSDHGVTQVDAAANAERPCHGLQPFDDGHRRLVDAVEAHRDAGADVRERNGGGQVLGVKHPPFAQLQRFVVEDQGQFAFAGVGPSGPREGIATQAGVSR